MRITERKCPSTLRRPEQCRPRALLHHLGIEPLEDRLLLSANDTLQGLIDTILGTFDPESPDETSPRVYRSGDAIPGTDFTVPNSVQIGHVPAALGNGSDLQLDNVTLTFPTDLSFDGTTWSGGIGVTALQGILLPGRLDVGIVDDAFDNPRRVKATTIHGQRDDGKYEVVFTLAGDHRDLGDDGQEIAVLNSDPATFDDLDLADDTKSILFTDVHFDETVGETDVTVEYNVDPGNSWTGGSLLAALNKETDGNDTDGNAVGVSGTIQLAPGNPSILQFDTVEAADIGFPRWLDIGIDGLEMEFPDFRADDSNNTLRLDASLLGFETGNDLLNDAIRNNPLLKLNVTGSVTGLEFDMDKLAEGTVEHGVVTLPKNPITDIRGISGQIHGSIFRLGSVQAGFIVEEVSVDEAGAITTQESAIAKTALYGAVHGTLSFAGTDDGKGGTKGAFSAGFNFAISELGPLQFFVFSNVNIPLEPVSGLAITELRGGVRLNANIEDLQVRPPIGTKENEVEVTPFVDPQDVSDTDYRITLTGTGHNLKVGDEFRIINAGNSNYNSGADNFVVKDVNGDDITYEVEEDPGAFTTADIRKMTISDPLDLRDPGFASTKDLSLGDWEAQLDQAVVNQMNAGDSVWDTLFDKAVIEAGATLSFDPRISDKLLSFDADLLFDTEGRLLVAGRMNLFLDQLRIPARLYADFSEVTEGATTFLFLADLPEVPQVLVARAGVTFETLIDGIPATLDADTGLPSGLGIEVSRATVVDLSGTGAGPWDVTYTLDLPNAVPSDTFAVGDSVTIVNSEPATFNGTHVVRSIDDDNDTITVRIGSQVIDGKLDVDGDGDADSDDDGFFRGTPVVDGALDVNRDGTIDGSDDSEVFAVLAGVVVGYAVIDGKVDVDGDDDVSSDADDDAVLDGAPGNLTTGGFAANLEDLGDGFRISVDGGIDLNIPGVTTVTLEGSAQLDFTVGTGDADARIDLAFDAALSERNVGTIAQANGAFHVTIDAGGGTDMMVPAVEIWGAAILDTDFGFLAPMGLIADAEGLLRINSSGVAKPVETLIDVDGNPVEVALPAESFALRLDGGIDFRIDFNGDDTFAESESVFQIGGIFVLEFSADQGFNVAIFDENYNPNEQSTQVGNASLTVGPVDHPFLEFGVRGFLAIRRDGVAADMVLTAQAGLPLGLASIDANAVFIVNTTGREVTFNIPGGATDLKRPTGLALTIPAAAPANPSAILAGPGPNGQNGIALDDLINGNPQWDEGEEEGDSGAPYGIVFLAGDLTVLSILDLEVSGYVLLSEDVFSLEANFYAAGNFLNLASASAHGTVFFSSQGEFVVDVGGEVQLGPNGFNISGSADLVISYLDDDGRGSAGSGPLILDISGSLTVSAEIFYIDVGSINLGVAYNSQSGEITVSVGPVPVPFFDVACTRIPLLGKVCIYYPNVEWRHVSFTVGSFKVGTDPPPSVVLGQVDASGVLTLNVGPHAAGRNLAVSDVNEGVVIHDVQAGSQTGRMMSITMFGVTQTFDNVTKILIPDMGGGDDFVEIMEGVDTEVEVHFGDGHDSLKNLGSGTVIAYGDGGNDRLEAGSAKDQLVGGTGADQFVIGVRNLALLGEEVDGGLDEDEIVIVGDDSAQDLRVTIDNANEVKISSYSDDLETGFVTLANVEAISLLGAGGADAFSVSGELDLGGVTSGVVVDMGSANSESDQLPDGARDTVRLTLSDHSDQFTLAPTERGIQGIWKNHFALSVLSGYASDDDTVDVFAVDVADDESDLVAVSFDPQEYGAYPAQGGLLEPNVGQEVYLTDENGHQFGPSYAVYDAEYLIIGALKVDSTGDESDGDFSAGNLSLREAIELANLIPGVNSITFDAALAGTTITLKDGELSITDDLTITGLGADQLTISGGDTSGIFVVDDADPAATITVEIRGLSLMHGHRSFGGAIVNKEDLTLTNCTLSGNQADYYGGGGVYNDGTLSVVDSTFSENSGGHGGGINNFSNGTLSVDSSTFSGNSAGYDGGGIYNRGQLFVANSTVSANTATRYGGGISNTTGGRLSVTNSTVVKNSDGGGIYTEAASTTLHNSIVAGNQDHDVFGKDVEGASSHNVIGAWGSGGLQDGSNDNVVGVEDLSWLAPLGDYGGPTETHALLSPSPAINAGDNELAARSLPVLAGHLVNLTLAEEGPAADSAGASVPNNLALAANGAVAFASSDLGAEIGTPYHRSENLNDGLYGNAFSWIGGDDNPFAPYQFAGIDLGAAPVPNIQSIAFGRSNVLGGDACPGGVCVDRYVGLYTIQYTQFPNPSTKLGLETGEDPTMGWVSIGTLEYHAGSGPNWLRHRYNFDPVDATGFRILVPKTGFADGTAIDEVELYDVPGTISRLDLVEEGPAANSAGASVPNNLALAANGGVAFASSQLTPYGHFTTNLNDGHYGNAFSWIGGDDNPFAPYQFAGIDLGAAPVPDIQSIAFGRSNVLRGDACPGGVCVDRYVGLYTIQYTQFPNPSTELGLETGEDPTMGWVNIGTLDYHAGSDPTWLRHRYNFDPVDATGFRILVPRTGLADGTAIDEVELYDVPGTISRLEVDQRGPGFPRVVSGTVDVGAFEVQDLKLAANTGIALDEGGTEVIDHSELQVTDVCQPADTLTYTIQTNVTHGQLLLGSDSLDVLDTGHVFTQADIDAERLSYAHDGSEGSLDHFVFTVSDGNGRTIGNTAFEIAIRPTNDPPTNTVPGSQVTPERTPLVFSAANGNGVSIGDVDAGNASVQVELSVGNGALTLVDTTGLAFETGDGTGDSGMRFTGTIADINAALNGLTYHPQAEFTGTDVLTMTTNDQGNTGAGGGRSDTDTVDIWVRPLVVDTAEDESDRDFSAGDLSLREAIALTNASPGADNIRFAESLSGSTITLAAGELPITDDLTITGLGADRLTVSGNSSSRIFLIDNQVAAAATVEINGLSLVSGISGHGGAILNREDLTFIHGTLANNVAGYGGGIVNEGILSVVNSTIANNSTTMYSGAGIYNESTGTLLVVNATISGNTAKTLVGGIRNKGTLAVVNSTIANNSGGGGIFTDEFASTTLHNTIVVGNQASDVAGKDVEGTSSHNLIGTGGSGGLQDGVRDNLVGVEDLSWLAPLGDYGGPTETHALLSTSPAINAGDNELAVARYPAFADRLVNLTLAEEGPAADSAGASVPNNLALAANGAVAFSSSQLTPYGHFTTKLNDGHYGNAFSWIGGDENPYPEPFAGIDLGLTPVPNVQSIAFGRSNVLSGDTCGGGVCADRHMGLYTLQYTQVSNPSTNLELETGDDPTMGWVNIGTLDYHAGSDPTWLRHRYNFEPVDATGFRILVPTTGLAGGTAIDEIELYDVPGDAPPPEDEAPPLEIDQRGPGFSRIVHTTVDIGAFEVQNVPPVLETNAGIALGEGGTELIDRTELLVTDVYQLTQTLEYTIEANVIHGTLQLGGVILGLGDSFTQADIDGGRLSYANNGTDGADSFVFSVSDGNGGTIGTTTFGITVNNVAPTASVTGSVNGVPGQLRTFTLFATDPSPVDQAAGFTYQIDWGDGSETQTVSGASAMEVSHTFWTVGTFPVNVTATDKDGGIGPATSFDIPITGIAVQDDDVAVGGTSIHFDPAGSSQISIIVNGAEPEVVTVLGRILAFGSEGGSDELQVNGTAGNDAITKNAGQITWENAVPEAIYYVGIETFTLDGMEGDDSYTVNFTHLFETVNVYDTGSSESDSLVANGADGYNHFQKYTKVVWRDVDQTVAVQTVMYSGVEDLSLVGGAGTNDIIDPDTGTSGVLNTRIVSGPGTNNILVTGTAGNGVFIDSTAGTTDVIIELGKLVAPVTITSQTAEAALFVTVVGTANADVMTVSGNTVQTAVGETINLVSQVDILTVEGQGGDDQITVAASTSVAEITLDGGGGDNTFRLVDVATSTSPPLSLTIEGGSDEGNNQVVVEGVPLPNMEMQDVAPFVEPITAPVDPRIVGSEISARVIFDDPDTDETYTATWDWGDGSTPVPEAAPIGAVVGYHTYSAAGVYTVNVTVADSHRGSTSRTYQYIVCYDPDGGFVTGGGWFDSPEGAYFEEGEPTELTGKANFGFVSKYKNGATTPTGETEFRFKVADLNFHSDSYQWLVVAGAHAKFKGDGTINGEGDYGFTLTASDGDFKADDDVLVDTFRIQIWSKDAGAGAVYDNQPAEDDDSYAGTELGGGSIAVHKEQNVIVDEGAGDSQQGALLADGYLAAALEQATAHWAGQGMDVARLSDVDIRVASLTGDVLATASASANLVWVDNDAAGYGWSVSAESVLPGAVDLLSVVTHELGHLLGLEHNVMGETLGVGGRRLPVLSPLAGYANRDRIFDRFDLMEVLRAGKYLTAEPASRGEGDFNGDGRFDRLDLVGVLQTGRYGADEAADDLFAQLGSS